MPRIVVSQFLTLDGAMQAPGDPNEDRRADFDQGGWQPGYFDEVFGDFVMEGFAAPRAGSYWAVSPTRASPATCRTSPPTIGWPAR
jgi:hypothetical protein